MGWIDVFNYNYIDCLDWLYSGCGGCCSFGVGEEGWCGGYSYEWVISCGDGFVYDKYRSGGNGIVSCCRDYWYRGFSDFSGDCFGDVGDGINVWVGGLVFGVVGVNRSRRCSCCDYFSSFGCCRSCNVFLSWWFLFDGILGWWWWCCFVGLLYWW